MNNPARRAICTVTVIYLLALPWQIPHHNLRRAEVFHFFNIGNTGVALHYPTVLTGDEPHYLVILNSLLEDFDLDLSNNYRQAREGDWDAGFWFRHFELDVHAIPDSQGHLYTYHHGVAMPLLLSLLSFPLRTTRWVEPLALAVSMAVALLALWLMGKILEKCGRPDLSAGTILLAGLGTPVFTYARGLWTENFTVLGFVLVLWLCLKKNESRILIGATTAGTILTRYPSTVIFVALAAASFAKEKKKALAIAAGVAATLVLIPVFNKIYYSQLSTPLKFEIGNPLAGLWGSLLDPVHGMLMFAPVLLFGIVELARWSRRGETLPLLLSAVVAAQILMTAFYQHWHGGSCYATRYLHTSLVPLAAATVLAWKENMSITGRAVYVVLLIYSVLVNVYAGFLPGVAVDRSPLQMVRHIAERLL